MIWFMTSGLAIWVKTILMMESLYWNLLVIVTTRRIISCETNQQDLKKMRLKPTVQIGFLVELSGQWWFKVILQTLDQAFHLFSVSFRLLKSHLCWAHLFFFQFCFTKVVWLISRLVEYVPPGYLFAFIVSHVVPVRQFFIATAIISQWYPSDKLLSFNTSLVIGKYH